MLTSAGENKGSLELVCLGSAGGEEELTLLAALAQLTWILAGVPRPLRLTYMAGTLLGCQYKLHGTLRALHWDCEGQPVPPQLRDLCVLAQSGLGIRWC